MKSPEEILKRWLPPVVFATWSGFLIYLLASQRFVAFLRPEFGLLLALANVIAMGFMLAAMMRFKATGMDLSAILRSLVLLVPVLYYVAMPDTLLGNHAFKKRFLGPQISAMPSPAPSTPPSQGSETDSDVAATPGEMEDARQETAQEQTILEIFLNPGFYQGKQVIFTGMILHDEQLKPHFGGKGTAVYRFLMNCCAADALPLAIALDADQPVAFTNDQWVQVDGIFDLPQINGNPVPLVLKPRIKPVEAPAVPYLF